MFWFDSVGVHRDILQNHAMVLLAEVNKLICYENNEMDCIYVKLFLYFV